MIKQTFVDDSKAIFVQTKDRLLYNYFSGKFIPFKYVFNEVHRCFTMGDHLIGVYHGSRLDIFDRAFDLAYNEQFDSLVVDDAHYSSEIDTLILLCDGRCLIFPGASNNTGDHTLFGDGSIEQCYLMGKHLWCHCNGQTDHYVIEGDIVHAHRVDLSAEEHRLITSFCLTDQPTMQELAFICNTNRFYDRRKKFYFVMGKNLCCLCDPAIIDMADIFSFIDNSGPIKEQELFGKTIVSLELPVPVTVKSHSVDQTIIVGETTYVIHESRIVTITFQEKDVVYDNDRDTRMRKVIVVDVEEDDIPKQMLAIIPQIYRLSHTAHFSFNIVDHFGNVTSHGSGVDRHVSDVTRDMIDSALLDLSQYSDAQCVKLGKLIYFFAINNQERFKNIHKYFFFLLCKTHADHRTLLNDELLYYYDKYENDESSLQELDLGINTIQEYVEYVISNDLSDLHKQKYKYVLQGYQFFCNRSPRKEFYKTVPVNYYCTTLKYVPLINYRVVIMNDLDPSITHEELIAQKNVGHTAIIKISELNLEQIETFTKNVTGTRDFTDVIVIILKTYETTKNYEISTCKSSLIIYNPTEERINAVIDSLTILDKHLVN